MGRGGNTVNVPAGFCLFSFSVDRDKMKKTFSSHLLKVGLYVEGRVVGKASINLSNVLESPTWIGSVELLAADNTVIGKMDVEIKLEEANKENDLGVSKKVSSELIANAAKELETWKLNQMRKFNDSLVQVEAQHLTLLGNEWKEREREREKVMQEKMESLKVLEQDLRQELDKIEVERKEVQERRKNLDIEKVRVDRDKEDIKNEKISSMEKLRQQLREKDAEIAVKNSEIEVLTNRLGSLQEESSRVSIESKKHFKVEAGLKDEVNKLKSEKVSLEARYDQAIQEKKFYIESNDQLKKDILGLQLNKDNSYSERIIELEKQVNDLSVKLSRYEEKVPVVASKPIPNLNVETQTFSTGTTDQGVSSINRKDPNLEGLKRLEEHLAMLHRNG